MNLSGASVEFRAFHCTGEEGWHEHTWTVTAWWSKHAWRDGRCVQKRLLAALEALTTVEDGQRRFPLRLWSNEALADALVLQAYVVRINIDRPGHHVEVWRA